MATGSTNNDNNNKKDSSTNKRDSSADIDDIVIDNNATLAFPWFGHIWCPKLGWHAHRTEASDALPEEREPENKPAEEPEENPGNSTTRSQDPAVKEWYSCLEESRINCLPKVVIADPLLVERLWQKNFRRTKCMYVP